MNRRFACSILAAVLLFRLAWTTDVKALSAGPTVELWPESSYFGHTVSDNGYDDGLQRSNYWGCFYLTSEPVTTCTIEIISDKVKIDTKNTAIYEEMTPERMTEADIDIFSDDLLETENIGGAIVTTTVFYGINGVKTFGENSMTFTFDPVANIKFVIDLTLVGKNGAPYTEQDVMDCEGIVTVNGQVVSIVPYRTSNKFSVFENLGKIGSIDGRTPDGFTWSLNGETGEFLIDGNGEMENGTYDYSDNKYLHWMDSKAWIRNVTIGDGITSIGDYAFSECEELRSVTLPEGVTRIGAHAFENCANLTNVILPKSLVSIGEDAFLGCGAPVEIPMIERQKPFTAIPTAATVLVNGASVAFDAYNIDGSNHFKLRDLAYALNGSAKQFEVEYDGASNAITLTSGAAYAPVGGEMAGKGAGNKQATPTASKTILDGKTKNLTAYNIDGNNYFKLRDIGEALDFGVEWDGAQNAIVIDTSKGYTPE
ncbi:MAG: leucine-rich repeat protein [Clostridiales Family XIII bacterium]|jgi:hypothetical protein|nr:leucine-rich repeat protein [Clostridiales Family XIII bacterium]